MLIKCLKYYKKTSTEFYYYHRNLLYQLEQRKIININYETYKSNKNSKLILVRENKNLVENPYLTLFVISISGIIIGKPFAQNNLTLIKRIIKFFIILIYDWLMNLLN